MAIHPRTEIDPSAEIADDVEIGPGVVIGPNAIIRSGVELGPNVIIGPNTTISEGARIYPGAIIGTEPQDMKFDGSPTECVIGARTIIREYCTINRGTAASRLTTVGTDCMLMSYSHVGHDCIIGDHVIMASAALIGGHCEIEDHAILGGNVATHQFSRIGKLAMVGGMSGLRQDAPPFMITSGYPPAAVYGVNSIGLKRNGMSPGARALIKAAFMILYRSGLNTGDALSKIQSDLEQTEEIEHLLDFYAKSRRGVARGHKDTLDADDDEIRKQFSDHAQLA